MAFDFEPSIILETAPQLLGGMKLTLIITLGGLLVGLLLGVVTGLANTSRSRFLRGIAILYIEAIRGTPLIVQVMFLYFGLPLALGMRIPPDVAGVIAIGVNSGAYIAEIVRGAIQSIDKGQTEAGRSTGLTQAQTMLYIIWPQAFRRMIPPLTNQCIISLKDTSLLVVIGVALVGCFRGMLENWYDMLLLSVVRLVLIPVALLLLLRLLPLLLPPVPALSPARCPAPSSM